MIPAVTAADVVVLKTGERVNGTVANRGILRSNPLMLTRISILVNEDAGDIRFYGLGEVDVVILEDGASPEIIDIADLFRGAAPPLTVTEPEEVREVDEPIGTTGSVIVIFLGGLVVAGALLTGANDGSGNMPQINIVLAIGGFLIMIAGFASLGRGGSEPAASAGVSPNGSYLLTLDRRF